jgi:hypothetical protein
MKPILITIVGLLGGAKAQDMTSSCITDETTSFDDLNSCLAQNDCMGLSEEKYLSE